MNWLYQFFALILHCSGKPITQTVVLYIQFHPFYLQRGDVLLFLPYPSYAFVSQRKTAQFR